MDAEDVRIVLLTGTPIINYPNEIAILFNILRGYIKTWSIKLNLSDERRIDKNYFKRIFKPTILGGNIVDYMDYNSSNTTLTITRNPFGFVNEKDADNKYDGVSLNSRGNLNDEVFIKLVVRILRKNRLDVNSRGIRVTLNKALPDNYDTFKSLFIDYKNNVKNMTMFKRRILGLSSYFRSAQESLLPSYKKEDNFHIVKIDMSDYQFGIYEKARSEERKLETLAKRRRLKQRNKNDLFNENISTYRIFSRAFCNFVFPEEIERPIPNKNEIKTKNDYNEDIIDGITSDQKIMNVDGLYEADEKEKLAVSDDSIKPYADRIKNALGKLKENSATYLTPDALKTYSPKFLKMLENIENRDHIGLHLIYSQFRTIEGIGILKLVLEANGYTQFKIKQVDGVWKLDIDEKNKGKPMFALYTGTETVEEKEIVRNVFNSNWDLIQPSLKSELQEIHENNYYGDVIKVLMITSSGAEGINLENVRYIHITESYWHPVRIQQVIGRGRRICSHKNLPEELRTIDVFLYLMTLSEAQKESDLSITLKLKDKSKIDNKTPVTSDEFLYEVASLKEGITDQILKSIKEASIDCLIHLSPDNDEKLKCFTFGSSNPDKFAYVPSYENEERDAAGVQNIKKIEWEGVPKEINGTMYYIRKDNLFVYDYDSFKSGNPVQVGKIIRTADKKIKFVRI